MLNFGTGRRLSRGWRSVQWRLQASAGCLIGVIHLPLLLGIGTGALCRRSRGHEPITRALIRIGLRGRVGFRGHGARGRQGERHRGSPIDLRSFARTRKVGCGAIRIRRGGKVPPKGYVREREGKSTRGHPHPKRERAALHRPRVRLRGRRSVRHTSDCGIAQIL